MSTKPHYEHMIDVAPGRPATETKPSASPIFRHICAKDGFPTFDVSTCYELFKRSVDNYPSNDCLGTRTVNADGTPGPYVFETYAQTFQKIEKISSGLKYLGVNPQDRVGIYGANSAEWMLSMQSCNRMGFCCVPMYDSLGENSIEYILNHAEVATVLTSGQKFKALLKALPKVSNVRSVIYWDNVDPESIAAAEALGIKVLTWASLLQLGSENMVEANPPSADDLCTIMYTSGTTGDPKGVLLKHGAVISCVASLHYYCTFHKFDLGAADVMLSYLPLAHIFDRVAEELMLYRGVAVGFWRGDVAKLVEDIAVLRPTVLIGVPRVFERIYNRINDQVRTSSFIRRSLFNWAVNRKTYFLKRGYPHAQAAPLVSKVVFQKVADRLGGRIRIIVSGGAPLAPHIETFMRVVFNAFVVQGYGLTETCAASFIASLDRMAQCGTVGPVMPLSELRLESVPEMQYDAEKEVEPKGEILIRGPQAFSGYYKDPVRTEEVLEKDGWFHTGDIGMITTDGALKIIDRKKNIFKLSQGEYVAVEKLESTYAKCGLVEQIWVYGNSFESCLVAVVVPNLARVAAALDLPANAGNAQEELCSNPKVSELLLKELSTTARAEKLKGFEVIKAVIVEQEHFSIENNLLTPTFKIKRNELLQKYQSQIDRLYDGLRAKMAA
uniref:Long-chain-fatty-acid--CoA ligase n=1 Tax=Polytomella parva TaxID=51329 RepID=A0A7S0UJY6_9CHLO|mmetsp:Transcript_11926/g.21390  ORF Transcript_11926/g.21390 Transcript_11926/m.21390 type:complete len:668 (+) Transcript_11926:47-2050(+)|eukprot:CAMPEP_0175042428 /NCGR_PEP_ID=MMETSP0052_2-20121109/2565_1 /TAXON_ID=51329 ORGANISM="Polytomella parva, Strain SAG 63-3" /NCGR_SAMPLE_ID=MMETSP0052_2 /ASSEMBLY_ACC=CAM_ASM_000194 /LENGTH=667 /DNA_ID=CAMNT_0016305253 /DNA_START=24 /DNA_END=2027 /DNA_ORIENTATION=+